MTVADNWEFMKSKMWSRLGLGFAVALILMGANAWVAHQAVRNLIESEHWVSHTAEVLREVETDVSLAKDVETGGRGYVITSNRKFLEPFEAAKHKVRDKLEPLYSMVRDNPPQQKRVLELAALIDQKLNNANQVVALIDAGQHERAVALIKTGHGKGIMDAIRAKANEIRAEEERLMAIRKASLKRAGFRANSTIWLAAGLSLLLLSLVYGGLVRAKLQSEELATALTDLKRLEAMRDSLNAMLVHDLRTPLTTILGPLEMLQSQQFGDLDETQTEIIGMSVLSSRRLLGLVNELLDVSKMEAGEMRLRNDSLRPETVIEESMRHISLAQYGGTARISHEAPESLPLLQADQELLTRVLINLLGNAIKFTPANGSITLGMKECQPLEVLPARVKSQLTAGEAERLKAPSLLFSVRDTGEGIPASELDRIFEKFGQVESRQAGHALSTGLGLTFCRLAVEAHGGVIWVESEVGRGSTFYFTIPLRTAVPTDEEMSKDEAAAALS